MRYSDCVVFRPGHALLLAALLLAGCNGGTAREILGFERNAPDEFAVVARPPLSVPPEFTLRPPQPGAEPAQSAPADMQARAVLTGGESPASGQEAIGSGPEASHAETSLLERAGVSQADPGVREKLRHEDFARAVQEEEQEKSGWFDFSSGSDDASVVDAKKEAERIKKNQAAGKPIHEGDVPVDDEEDRGILRDLF